MSGEYATHHLLILFGCCSISNVSLLTKLQIPELIQELRFHRILRANASKSSFVFFLSCDYTSLHHSDAVFISFAREQPDMTRSINRYEGYTLRRKTSHHEYKKGDSVLVPHHSLINPNLVTTEDTVSDNWRNACKIIYNNNDGHESLKNHHSCLSLCIIFLFPLFQHLSLY